MKEIKIVRIEPVGAIYKATGVFGPGFCLNTILHLEDGRAVQSRVSATRKKDVMRSLESEKAAICSGCMKASFDDAGAFFGTVTECYIGPTKKEAA